MTPNALLNSLECLKAAWKVVATAPLHSSSLFPQHGLKRRILLARDQACYASLAALQDGVSTIVDGNRLGPLIELMIEVLHAADILDAVVGDEFDAAWGPTFRDALTRYREFKTVRPTE